MGERKVLNKYFPPDFDPSKLPKGKRPDHNSMKVRMMLPMSVRCNTCGNFMYKGTKFNCKKQVRQHWLTQQSSLPSRDLSASEHHLQPGLLAVNSRSVKSHVPWMM